MFGQGLNFGGLTGSAGIDADFLVIAGGGGGGWYTNGTREGGGGGAGGYRTSYGTSGGNSSAESSLALTPGTSYTVTIGQGGSGGASPTNGGNSIFSSIISLGGGYGGGAFVYAPNNGGSGGGNGGFNIPAGFGTGTSGQGTNGGAKLIEGRGGTGGGGALSAGLNSSDNAPSAGGAGLASTITGTSITRAGGGGGGADFDGSASSTVGAAGGIGGGGKGAGASDNSVAGTINTGSGGGGGSGNGAPGRTSSPGGSGTVILRYPTVSVSSYAVTGTLDTTANTAYPIANTAYYKLNGNANDSSGNGYNGTFTGPAYATGKFGNAASFGGSNYITVTGFTSTTTFSYSFWVNPTNASSSGFKAIIGNQTSGGQLFTDAGALKIYANTTRTFSGSPTLADNTWSHVALSVSNGTGTIYVNGINKGTASSLALPSTSYIATASTQVGVGTYNYTGKIDQVRIFNSALTAGNVTSLYNESTVNESTDGTDSVLQFIGGSGDITFS